MISKRDRSECLSRRTKSSRRHPGAPRVPVLRFAGSSLRSAAGLSSKGPFRGILGTQSRFTTATIKSQPTPYPRNSSSRLASLQRR